MIADCKLRGLNSFKNAYIIHHQGLIKLKDVTTRKVYYDVEDPESGKIHQVTIGFDAKKKVIGADCCCTVSSVKSKYYPLCSHKIAAITRAMFDLGRPKKRG